MVGGLSMPQLALGCPHCRADPVGFTPRGCVPVKPGTVRHSVFLQCEACGMAIIAVIDNATTHITSWMNGNANSPGQIIARFPQMVEMKSPPDVPQPVTDAYLSGLDNLGRKNGANAAAIMFRRAIEIATKTIPDVPKKGNLKERIDNLPGDLATPAMKDLAHHVRLDANDATHEVEEFSEEDAKKLQVFTELFLTYAFTQPAMLKHAKGEVS
jgi:hypothetical protein